MFKAEISCDCKCGCKKGLTWGEHWGHWQADFTYEQQWAALKTRGWTKVSYKAHKCPYCTDYCDIAIESKETGKVFTWAQVSEAAAISQDPQLIALATTRREWIKNRWKVIDSADEMYSPPGICCERHYYVESLRHRKS